MLRYSEDKRYIIQENKDKKDRKQTFGPYNKDMLPEIKNADRTERNYKSIPRTSEESVLYQYPELQHEFIRFIDPKYQNLGLKDVKKDCGLKAEFKCSTCNNKWIAVIRARTIQCHGCGHCCKQHIQFPEKYLFYCLSQIDNNMQENYKIPGMNIVEFDMYDPALKLAIEFSSGKYHSDRQNTDEQKLRYAINNNIRLIRVWQIQSEKQVSKFRNDEFIVPNKHSINGVPDLNIIIDDICKQYDLDQSLIDRKAAQNMAFIRTNQNPPEGQSLLSQYPDLCRDWDYSKNGAIKPEMLYSRSGIKVHWKCMYCGKSWITQPNARTNFKLPHRAGCQQCSQRIRFGSLKEIPYIPDNKSNKA